ncbi:hypothetical protein C4900_15290 [Acidiferrobacter thiooxydans]|uniref:Integrase n=1 Tax=Acidiferrobacter thiooxydans TaxID=163359 RepID=A0A368HJ50_9GAMM|nr:hypothetical protein C4900_15290 [Acidiferrobacter thiooxydans]
MEFPFSGAPDRGAPRHQSSTPRAAQLPLGHSKPQSTVRYLSTEVDDALEISELTEISPAPCGRM